MRLKKCPICYCYTKGADIVTLSCDCFGCHSCLTEWTLVSIDKGNLDNVDDYNNCHVEECYTYRRVQEVYEKLPLNYQEKINKALFENYLIKDYNIRKCPKYKCPYAGIISISNCSDYLECPICETRWLDYDIQCSKKGEISFFRKLLDEFGRKMLSDEFTKASIAIILAFLLLFVPPIKLFLKQLVILMSSYCKETWMEGYFIREIILSSINLCFVIPFISGETSNVKRFGLYYPVIICQAIAIRLEILYPTNIFLIAEGLLLLSLSSGNLIKGRSFSFLNYSLFLIKTISDK